MIPRVLLARPVSIWSTLSECAPRGRIPSADPVKSVILLTLMLSSNVAGVQHTCIGNVWTVVSTRVESRCPVTWWTSQILSCTLRATSFPTTSTRNYDMIACIWFESGWNYIFDFFKFKYHSSSFIHPCIHPSVRLATIVTPEFNSKMAFLCIMYGMLILYYCYPQHIVLDLPRALPHLD